MFGLDIKIGNDLKWNWKKRDTIQFIDAGGLWSILYFTFASNIEKKSFFVINFFLAKRCESGLKVIIPIYKRDVKCKHFF